LAFRPLRAPATFHRTRLSLHGIHSAHHARCMFCRLLPSATRYHYVSTWLPRLLTRTGSRTSRAAALHGLPLLPSLTRVAFYCLRRITLHYPTHLARFTYLPRLHAHLYCHSLHYAAAPLGSALTLPPGSAGSACICYRNTPACRARAFAPHAHTHCAAHAAPTPHLAHRITLLPTPHHCLPARTRLVGYAHTRGWLMHHTHYATHAHTCCSTQLPSHTPTHTPFTRYLHTLRSVASRTFTLRAHHHFHTTHTRTHAGLPRIALPTLLPFTRLFCACRFWLRHRHAGDTYQLPTPHILAWFTHTPLPPTHTRPTPTSRTHTRGAPLHLPLPHCALRTTVP